MTIHDFRVVRGTTHDNLIFDAVLPFSSSKTPAQAAAGDPRSGPHHGRQLLRRGHGGAQLHGLRATPHSESRGLPEKDRAPAAHG